ncbi:MAG: hypothetical protein A4S09_01370 [Proteobacteria bacterium SG_bin7]|nr:MAG: hypothetical protein A4S09_01370 [Proteobacteria bacterium SG_bin7]
MNFKYFDTLLDSIFLVDEKMEVIYCNEAAAELTGISNRRLRSSQLKKVLTLDNNLISKIENSPKKTDSFPYTESKYTSSKGKTGIVWIAAQRVENNKWLLIFRNMTIEAVLQKKYQVEIEEKKAMIVKLENAQKELEKYSKNLEDMVRDRTKLLNKANQLLKAILNSLGQALIVFDEKGRLLPFFSRVCEDLLGLRPPYRWLGKVLNISKGEDEVFQTWLRELFKEKIPFDSLKDLGPKKLSTVADRHIELDYFPIRKKDGKISSVVMVGTDKTEEYKAKAEAIRDRKYVQQILKITCNRPLFLTFLKDARRIITGLEHSISPFEKNANVDFATSRKFFLRAIHTLKGGSMAYSTLLAESCHEMEVFLINLKLVDNNLTGSDFEKFQDHLKRVREDFESLLKQTKDIVGPTGFNWSSKTSNSLNELHRITTQFFNLKSPSARMSYMARELFFEPIINALSDFDDVVLSTAAMLGKKVNPIVFRNPDVKVFPEKYSNLLASLIHAFKNSVDHGIEFPSVRKANGKPETGLIMVTCEEYEEKNVNWLKIVIEDDGSGIDPRAIRRKMVEKNIPGHDKQSDEEVLQNIFLSRFTTKESVTEISGHGLGLDAIRYEAQLLGGWTKIKSMLGKGTILEIAVPNHIDELINRLIDLDAA